MVTDSGEGGGLVDVSAASSVLAVMHAVSGGVGGWCLEDSTAYLQNSGLQFSS